METPKSVEATKILAFEFYQRCGQHKGTPAERKMQERVMKAVEACDDWTKSDDPKGQSGFIFPEAAPEPDGDTITPTEGKAIDMWGVRQRAWLDETAFIPMDKKARAFMWKTFYAPMFDEAITPQDEKHIERMAKVLGKSGSLADMREDVGEWEDAEEDEGEEG